jgi:hypothetical protein
MGGLGGSRESALVAKLQQLQVRFSILRFCCCSLLFLLLLLLLPSVIRFIFKCT